MLETWNFPFTIDMIVIELRSLQVNLCISIDTWKLSSYFFPNKKYYIFYFIMKSKYTLKSLIALWSRLSSFKGYGELIYPSAFVDGREAFLHLPTFFSIVDQLEYWHGVMCLLLNSLVLGHKIFENYQNKERPHHFSSRDFQVWKRRSNYERT